jgi:hypothetical protein
MLQTLASNEAVFAVAGLTSKSDLGKPFGKSFYFSCDYLVCGVVTIRL